MTNTPKPNETKQSSSTIKTSCHYKLNDSLACTMRKVIAKAPVVCQEVVLFSFSVLFPPEPDDITSILPFNVMKECQTYLKSAAKSNKSSYYNASSICSKELFDGIDVYTDRFNYQGNVVNYLPSKQCVPYLTNFINDVLKYPDNACLNGCTATTSNHVNEL